MVAGCGATFSKIILFIFNALLFIMSVLLIAGSVYGLVTYSKADESLLKVFLWVWLGLSIFICVSAFCSCCGAYQENECLLKFFIATLSTVILTAVVILIVLLVKRDSMADGMAKFYGTIKNKYPDETKDPSNYTPAEKLSRSVWDFLQKSGECCGDENNNAQTFWNNVKLPISCCKYIDADKWEAPDQTKLDECRNNAKNQYTKGCFKTLKEKIGKLITFMAVVLGLISLLPIVEIIFAQCLLSAL